MHVHSTTAHCSPITAYFHSGDKSGERFRLLSTAGVGLEPTTGFPRVYHVLTPAFATLKEQELRADKDSNS